MKLSVVIPFYNLERYVRPCLDSVVSAARGVDAWLSLSEDRAAPTVRLGGTDSD